MNLVKEKWRKEDKVAFLKYLKSFENQEKQAWSKKIINTELVVLAVRTKDIKYMAQEILKGNFLSFLDLNIDDYYESIALQGMLISKIKDFAVQKEYLDKYVIKIDNWAGCDLLSFDVKGKEAEFLDLILEYIESPLPFVRRTGLVILFSFIDKDDYLERVFIILNSFYDEKEYYVNMIIAWLFCECFIKRREEALKFLQTHRLNKFAINKGISKCRDSYRVSQEDKEMLLKYRVKKNNV